MSIESTTAPVIDTTTDAYADYVACDVDGMSQSDRAAARGIRPATVSANVRRIRALIASGASTDGDDGTPTVAVLPFDAWVGATYGDDAALVARMCADGVADAMRSHDRARVAIERANAAMATADADVARVASVFDRATDDDVPPFDDVRTAYTTYADDARSVVTATDAPADADASTDTDAPADA